MDTRNKIIKIINKILAISAASAAIPPKPRTPAIIATIRNTSAQLNIIISPVLRYD
jgi:hypothetical protein